MSHRVSRGFRSRPGWSAVARATCLLVAAVVTLAVTGCKGRGGDSANAVPPTPTPGVAFHQFTIDEHAQGWAELGLDQATLGGPLTIAGTGYATGIGTHAKSRIRLGFGKGFQELSGACGVNDNVGKLGSVVFRVLDGERLLWESPLMRGSMPAVPFRVPVTGLTSVILVVDDGGDGFDYDNADWVDLTLR
jgi:hypothetical protein